MPAQHPPSRSRPQARTAVVAILLGSLLGCGSTLKDVPRLNAYEIEFQGFSLTSPGTLSVRVVDERPEPMRKNQKELERALQHLLGEVLAGKGVQVAELAPVTLTLRVRDASGTPTGEFKHDRCVALLGRLERPGVFFAEAAGFGCHDVRNALGMKLGGDISQAYRVSLIELLRTLSAQTRQLSRSAELSAGGEAAPSRERQGWLTVQVLPPAARLLIDGVEQTTGWDRWVQWPQPYAGVFLAQPRF